MPHPSTPRVSVEHPAVTVGAELMDLGDRVVRPPPGPEPVGDRHEVGLEDGFQHQLQRRLHHPAGDGGDADRHRTELARLHLPAQIVQEPLDTSLVDVAGPQTVDTGVGDAGAMRTSMAGHQPRWSPTAAR